jgi:hypothetical protein
MANDILLALPSSLRTTENDQSTEYFEVRGKQLLAAIDLFMTFDGDYTKLSEAQIDSLAPFFGFHVDTFWRNSWSKSTKARLLKGVYQDPFIWFNNGSYAVLNYVFSCFDLNAQLVKDSGFTVNVSIVGLTNFASGDTYNLEVKDLTYSKQRLCEYILSVFFPLGFVVKIVSV